MHVNHRAIFSLPVRKYLFYGFQDRPVQVRVITTHLCKPGRRYEARWSCGVVVS